LAEEEERLDAQLADWRIAERDLRKEAASVSYVARLREATIRPLPALRALYRTEVARFEGRFRNTKAS
jgi:hypothetical protein